MTPFPAYLTKCIGLLETLHWFYSLIYWLQWIGGKLESIIVIFFPSEVCTHLFICIFRIVENELFKHDWRSRKKVQFFQYMVLKWAFALLIGLGTGLVGFFNNIAVENIAGFKLLLTTDLLSQQKWALCPHPEFICLLNIIICLSHNHERTYLRVLFLYFMHVLEGLQETCRSWSPCSL